MSPNLLQLSERATKAEGQIFGHPQTDNHVGLPRSVPMLGDGGERHAHQAFLVEKLGEEIDVERLNPVVEDNDPIVVMSDFPYRSRHVTSLRKTWVGLNLLECAA